jgi:hypothetical protein
MTISGADGHTTRSEGATNRQRGCADMTDPPASGVSSGVRLGGLVIAEPGVAGGGVEDPLSVVEHEVVLGGACAIDGRPHQLVRPLGIRTGTPHQGEPL